MAATDTRRQSRVRDPVELIVYKHTSVVYWWPVWLYGSFCAAWTYFFGNPVQLGGHKPVAIYHEAWLGFSFLLLFCVVFWATHIKARGVWSLVVVLLLAGAIFTVQ